MAEFIYKKWKAEKEFAQLLNKYYRERQLYEEAIKRYNKAKENYRRFSKEENQLRKAMERLKKSYGYEAFSNKEWSTYYNKHFIPTTVVDKKELRKTHAEDCKRAKELVKLHQQFFNKAFLELKYFATYKL